MVYVLIIVNLKYMVVITYDVMMLLTINNQQASIAEVVERCLLGYIFIGNICFLVESKDVVSYLATA